MKEEIPPGSGLQFWQIDGSSSQVIMYKKKDQPIYKGEDVEGLLQSIDCYFLVNKIPDN